MAGQRRRQLLPREKRQVAAGRADGVGIEQVVGPGIVLVDGLLDQAHAEHAGVEVDVLLRLAGDCGDVMDAVHGTHGRSIGEAVILGSFRSLRIIIAADSG